MVDPLVLSHRELRAALHLAERELKRGPQTPGRLRLLEVVHQRLDDAKVVALVCGADKVPAPEGPPGHTIPFAARKPVTDWAEVMFPNLPEAVQLETVEFR